MRYIHGKRVMLKEGLSRSNMRKLFIWIKSDPEHARFWTNYDTLDDLKKHYEDTMKHDFVFSVYYGSFFHRFVGEVSLWNRTKDFCLISIFISNKFARKGIGAEAMMLALEFSFNELDLKNVYYLVAEKNVGSILLVKRFGFVEHHISGMPNKTEYYDTSGELKECKLLHFGISKEKFYEIKNL